jgi:WD40 repeat protein
MDTADVLALLAPPQGPGELGRLGGYGVLKVLGAGGMGVVFQAEDPQLKRLVALKVMRPTLAASESARQRFLREAQAMAAVRHDHIVTIYQVGEDRAVPFLAMEFLEGRTLAELLKATRRLRPAQVVRIGLQVAQGLAAAHERGLIHRDIKPANLWLEAVHGGRVKILDFGLARAADDEAHLTGTGHIVGTPAYMSPEQARGEAVDLRCDLFGLGCVLYRMVTGEPPFRGTDAVSTLLAVATATPQPVRQLAPDTPAALAQLIERLLAKAPANRPSSAAEAAAALAGIAEAPAPVSSNRGQTETISLPGRAGQAARPKVGRRRLTVAVAACCLLVLLVGLTFWPGGGPDGEALPEGQADAGGKPGPGPGPKPRQGAGPPVEPLVIKPDPVNIKAGAPLGTLALVTQPTHLDGVQSWTIEPRFARAYGLSRFSPDCRHYAHWEDGAIRVWEADRHKLVRVLVLPERGVASLSSFAWSKNGKMLAVDCGGNVFVWEIDTGRLVRTYRFGKAKAGDTAIHLSWAPDSRTLVARRGDLLRLCDVATGKETWEGGVRPGTPDDPLAWAPDGKKLIVGAGKNTLELLDLEDHSLVVWDVDSPLPIVYADWSPDGKAIAIARKTGDGREGVSILRVNDKTVVPVAEWPRTSNYGELAWSPDGKELFVAAGGGVEPGVWDADNGKKKRRLNKDTQRYGYPRWSPDGKTIRLAHDIEVSSIDALTGDLVDSRNLGSEELTVLVELDVTGRKLASSTGRKQGRLWEPEGERPWRIIPVGGGDLGVVYFRFAPSAPVLAAALRSGMVERWNVETFKRKLFPVAEDRHVTALAWSPDGTRLAVARERNAILLFDGTTGQLSGNLPDKGWVAFLAWSPDGKTLASWSGNEMGYWLRLWDVRSMKATRLDPKYGIAWMGWSADGSRLAHSSGQVDVVEWWDARTREQLPAVTLEHCRGYGLPAWGPDGRHLFGYDFSGRSLVIWDCTTGRKAGTIGQLDADPRHLAWSQDGKRVAALGKDCWVRVWDVSRARLLYTFGELKSGRYLIVTPDGHYRGSPGVEDDLVYVVLTRDGRQEMLSPEAFSKRFGWKNDPSRVRQAGR